MADLSVSGLATGMDTASLISQLMALERQPENILSKKKTTLQDQVSEFNKINTSLTTLQSFFDGINTASEFKAKSASVGDSTVVTATAGSTASPGVHSLKVVSLASSQNQVSQGYASTSTQIFGTGTLTITGASGSTSVTIDSANNSLDGIAAAINASGANVTASVINDGTDTPYRLSITGKDTGSYTVDASGLTGGSATNPVFDEKVPGAKAHFYLDGVEMYRTSNSFSDAIPGVTLTLLAANDPKSTTITVTNDNSTITSRINSFVSSYNDAMDLLNRQSVYDATTKKAGVLSGDSTVRDIKFQLQSILTNRVAGVADAYSTLSQLGIKTDSTNGSLSVDTTKLNDALTNHYDDVVALFTQNAGVPNLAQNQYGVAEQFRIKLEKMTHSYVGSGSSDNGMISTKINSINKTMQDITDQITSMEVLMTQKEENLKKQFASMESLVSSLSSQGNAMIAALNKM